ncbi:MAG: flippase-like domain-containing protein [Chloroflexi bacterium]|nr:flippase-like domain-containing protein [Chloroflexota bacterium]
MADSQSDTQSVSGVIALSVLRKRLLSIPNLIAVLIAFSVGYFLVVKFDFDMGGTWETIRRNNLLWYALAFPVYYMIFPLRAIRWRVLLEDSGCSGVTGPGRISILRLAEISFLGWFLNTVTIFRMGFLYRCYQLSSRLKSNFALVAGGLFAERVLDTVVTFGLLGLAALGLLSSHWSPVVSYVLLGGLVTSLVIGGVPMAMILVGMRPPRFMPERFKEGYGSFRDGTLKSFRRWPRLVVLSLAIWSFETARLMLVVESLDLSLSIPMALFVALSASLITHFPITPGGLGLVEAGMTGLLAMTLAPEEALSVALLDRSINYLSVLAFGGALFLARSSPALGRRLKWSNR